MKRYQLDFLFFATEEAAKKFCEIRNKNSTPYIRKNKPAHYTKWSAGWFENLGATDIKCDKQFIAWFYS